MVKPVMKAFDQGSKPTIAVFNKATTPLGVDFDALISAMQIYIDNFLAPIWNTPALLQKSTDFISGAWALVFFDDADVSGALAYHDLTPDGLPISKVFVRTTLQNHELVSVSASHELAEMMVDPGIQMMVTSPNGKIMYAYEVCDPCENLSFPVNVPLSRVNIQMSNFVYPSFFEGFRKPSSDRFDQMAAITRPFQVLPGGYQIISRNGRWTQIFGSEEKKQAFALEDRRGHRCDARVAAYRSRD